ncbi:MAG: hypothetical protein ACREGE_03610 [Candidatus Microsaccharimonas sp.]
MNVWCHLPTIFSQRRFLRIASLLTLCAALITTLFFNVISTYAAPGVNQTISFQGRILDKNGSPVPEGYYNVQFKIYQDGTGTEAGNPDSTLKWTETYTNNGSQQGIYVKNGYLAVDLGSKNPFGTQVDWDQSTLWLSMNIAGSSGPCTTFGTAPCMADGEMLPMKRLTATPYALNSARLEGKSADDFVQNSTEQQTGNFNISGTGIATTLQGNSSVIAPLFDSTAAGSLSIGTANATSLSIGTSSTAQTIVIGSSATGAKNVTVGSLATGSQTLLQGGDLGVSVVSEGGFGVGIRGYGYNSLLVGAGGNIDINLRDEDGRFAVNDDAGNAVLSVHGSGNILTRYDSLLTVNGGAVFNQGISIQGGTGLTYTTPGGYNMSTAINIPNYRVGDYSSIFAFGLPANSSPTARGMLVADARTTDHQATIGVLSPDENQVLGLSWGGSTTTGRLTSTSNKLALQGGGLDLLTVNKNGNAANVGIGNDASSGYALDVTGSANLSGDLAINGVSVLNNTGLNFTGASTANVSAASGQTLQLNGSNVRVGDGAAGSEPTLLTVDKSNTTPTATGEAILGSMYYDTTLGKIQCYEADGWGACSTSPDNFITLSPEYTNAVTNGSGTGDLTTDICSDTLNINDGSATQPTICGTNETYNFYNWTSTETTAQTKSIYVTYQLPENFTSFVEGSTSLLGRTDSADAAVSYQVYRNTAGGLIACGAEQDVSTGAQTTWQKTAASGNADPANCNLAAGESIVFKINLTASNDANAYVSTLGFAFSDN